VGQSRERAKESSGGRDAEAGEDLHRLHSPLPHTLPLSADPRAPATLRSNSPLSPVSTREREREREMLCAQCNVYLCDERT
jgi:hypothetical protein